MRETNEFKSNLIQLCLCTNVHTLLFAHLKHQPIMIQLV